MHLRETNTGSRAPSQGIGQWLILSLTEGGGWALAGPCQHWPGGGSEHLYCTTWCGRSVPARTCPYQEAGQVFATTCFCRGWALLGPTLHGDGRFFPWCCWSTPCIPQKASVVRLSLSWAFGEQASSGAILVCAYWHLGLEASSVPYPSPGGVVRTPRQPQRCWCSRPEVLGWSPSGSFFSCLLCGVGLLCYYYCYFGL